MLAMIYAPSMVTAKALNTNKAFLCNRPTSLRSFVTTLLPHDLFSKLYLPSSKTLRKTTIHSHTLTHSFIHSYTYRQKTNANFISFIVTLSFSFTVFNYHARFSVVLSIYLSVLIYTLSHTIIYYRLSL